MFRMRPTLHHKRLAMPRCKEPIGFAHSLSQWAYAVWPSHTLWPSYMCGVPCSLEAIGQDRICHESHAVSQRQLVVRPAQRVATEPHDVMAA